MYHTYQPGVYNFVDTYLNTVHCLQSNLTYLNPQPVARVIPIVEIKKIKKTASDRRLPPGTT